MSSCEQKTLCQGTFILIINRICVRVATESMEGTRTLGIVLTMIDCCIQWECVKHVTCQTITR